MIAAITRALLVLFTASIGYVIAEQCVGVVYPLESSGLGYYGLIVGLIVGVLIILLEMIISRRPVQSISSIIFGLIAGSILALLISYPLGLALTPEVAEVMGLNAVSLDLLRALMGLFLVGACSYVFIMVIYKTSNRFRFIIPYTEFRPEEQGGRPIVLDTSAIIDGRLADLCETGLFDTALIVPKFVLTELQHIADSGDRLRRNRGRRGLEMLQRLQRDERVSVQIHDARSARGSTVDSKLISLCTQLQARILTCDYNLQKIAELQNVETLNLNDLASALRPAVLPGEELNLKIIRPGDEPGQGVGYLNDGTMVVVEQAREKIGEMVCVAVTSSLQTSAGRMIFGRIRQPGAPEEKEPARKKGAQ